MRATPTHTPTPHSRAAHRWSSLLLPLLFAGCYPQPTDEPIAPITGSIVLDISEINAPSKGIEETIKLTTPPDMPWEYTLLPNTSSHWITVQSTTESSTSIPTHGVQVVIAPNSSAATREATLMIIAGAKAYKLPIRQAGAPDTDGHFTAPQQVYITTDGGTIPVDVDTDATQWQLSSDGTAPWLTATASAESGLIVLTAEPNYTDQSRSTKLLLSSLHGQQSITVTQAGLLKYFVPIEGDRKHFDRHSIVMAELKRGLRLSNIIEGAPADENDWYSEPTPDVVTFVTGSSAISSITYRRPYGYIYPLYVERVDLTLIDPAEMAPGGGYLEYLLSNGYKHQFGSSDDAPRLEREDGYFFVRTSTDTQTGVVTVSFVPQLIQDMPYPTLPAWPIDLQEVYDHLDNTEYKYSDIEQYHLGRGDRLTIALKNQRGRTEDEKAMTALAIFGINHELNPTDPYDAVWYDLNVPTAWNKLPIEQAETLRQIRYSISDYNRVIYLIPIGEETQFKVTDEFRALAESVGFEYRGVVSGGLSFIHQTEGLDMVVQMAADYQNLGAERSALLTMTKRAKATTNNSTTAKPNTTYSAEAAKGYVSAMQRLNVSR